MYETCDYESEVGRSEVRNAKSSVQFDGEPVAPIYRPSRYPPPLPLPLACGLEPNGLYDFFVPPPPPLEKAGGMGDVV